MALSDRHLLGALSRTPFVDSAELARILGEAHATVHRALAGLLAEGIVGRVSHGTAYLPSSQRYHLTANGIRQAAGILGSDTPSDFVRAYTMSMEWLTPLIRRVGLRSRRPLQGGLRAGCDRRPGGDAPPRGGGETRSGHPRPDAAGDRRHRANEGHPGDGRRADHLPVGLRAGRAHRPGLRHGGCGLRRQALLADGACGQDQGGPAQAGGLRTGRAVCAGRPDNRLRRTRGDPCRPVRSS